MEAAEMQTPAWYQLVVRQAGQVAFPNPGRIDRYSPELPRD